MTRELLECLDAIHRLGGEGAGPSLGQVAKRLSISREAAGERVRRLESLGLVEDGAHGRLALTADGGDMFEVLAPDIKEHIRIQVGRCRKSIEAAGFKFVDLRNKPCGCKNEDFCPVCR